MISCTRIKNALIWGNFSTHCQKAKLGKHKAFHITMAIAEFLPLIGQAISLIELLFTEAHQQKNASHHSIKVSTKTATISTRVKITKQASQNFNTHSSTTTTSAQPIVSSISRTIPTVRVKGSDSNMTGEDRVLQNALEIIAKKKKLTFYVHDGLKNKAESFYFETSSLDPSLTEIQKAYVSQSFFEIFQKTVKNTMSNFLYGDTVQVIHTDKKTGMEDIVREHYVDEDHPCPNYADDETFEISFRLSAVTIQID